MRDMLLTAGPLVGWFTSAAFAQVAASEPTLLNAMANLGGLGILSLVLWRLHDQARSDAREDRAAERKLWNEHLEEFRQEATRRHQELLAAIRDHGRE